MRSSTVLPEPLPPITASVVPLASARLTPRSTSVAREGLPHVPKLDEGRWSHVATHQNRKRKSLVRKKSETMTPMATWTTVAVVDRPSPSVPPSVASPL